MNLENTTENQRPKIAFSMVSGMQLSGMAEMGLAVLGICYSYMTQSPEFFTPSIVLGGEGIVQWFVSTNIKDKLESKNRFLDFDNVPDTEESTFNKNQNAFSNKCISLFTGSLMLAGTIFGAAQFYDSPSPVSNPHIQTIQPE